MTAPFGYPSTFDGSSAQWTMVAPQAQYYGAQYDHLYAHHQASLLQVAQQQQQHAAAAAAFAAQHASYNPAAYAHGQAAFYPAQHVQYAAPQVEQARSRFAFAQQQQQQRFNLPPPAAHATQQRFAADEYNMAASYGHAESASRATLESEHLSFLLGRLAQSADSAPSPDEYDHPSHIRPPHRNELVEEQQITYDLIPNVSTVPPPPPIERSAVPLADLAAEMVWEICRQGFLHYEANMNAMLGQQQQQLQQLPQRAGPRRSNGAEFGAIGSGRTRTLSQNSSPSSSLPGTPSGIETLEDVMARRQRLANLGLGSFQSSSNSAFPVKPSPAFRQFVRQILTATLVTPEDLVYALALVSMIPVDKIIPATPAEPGQDAQTTSFKAAPFKIVLGALMIANKTLQDNSYRNETFSTVSGIPLADVNALEAHVFTALMFDVAIREDKWAAWLAVVVDRVRSGRGELGDLFAVQDALERLVRAHARHSASPLPASPVALTPVNAAAVAATKECPSTPLNSSTSSSIHDIDLDASGPMRSVDVRRPVAVTTAAGARGLVLPLARQSLAVAQAQAQDSPLVARSTTRSCRGGNHHNDYSLFPPADLGAVRSRSFGQEIARNAIC
ncbi:hypothetical protein JCM6882_000813 [Rhodosporidiobolus microsporus]